MILRLDVMAMKLSVRLDKDLTHMSQALIFSCDEYVLTHEDIAYLKEEKYIQFVKWDDLPQEIECKCMVTYQAFNRLKVMLYNDKLPLPFECHDEPFLNKDLLEWAERNDGTFWIEFDVDPRSEMIDMEIKMDSGKE